MKKYILLLLPAILLSSCAAGGSGKSVISPAVRQAIDHAVVTVVVAGEAAAVDKITSKLGPKVAKSGK